MRVDGPIHIDGDILFSTQVLVTNLVTTFLGYTWRVVQSNKMSMLSRSVWFDGLSGLMVCRVRQSEKFPYTFYANMFNEHNYSD